MIELCNVTKRYGATEAVSGLSFFARKGRLWACWGKTARERPPR